MMRPLRMQPTGEVWVRVLGMTVINIGIFFWVAAQTEAVALFRATLYVRPLVLAWLAAFVLLGLAPPQLLVFGLVETAGALWTWLALRADLQSGQPANPVSRIDPRYESRM